MKTLAVKLYINGMSCPEIADFIGVSRVQVWSYVIANG